MHSPEDINFIEISDFTNSADARSLITVSDTEIMIDVYHLLSNEENIDSLADLNTGHDLECQNDNMNEAIPHPKVTSLPSKDLHGVWKSCAGLLR